MTNIEWTHPPGYRGESWNFLRGCSRTIAVGAKQSGCGDSTGGGCYAERDGGRWCGEGEPYHDIVRLTKGGARWTGRVAFIEHRLLDPLRHKEPRCYFVNSVSDLFHREVPDEIRDRALAVIALAPRHLYIALTKHGADNGSLERYFNDRETPTRIASEIGRLAATTKFVRPAEAASVGAALVGGLLWPLPRLIVGVSTENQAALSARAPALLRSQVWCRALSVEPLLEEVDVAAALPRCSRCARPAAAWDPSWRFNGMQWEHACDDRATAQDGHYTAVGGVDWIIAGGESGPRARPCALEWLQRVASDTWKVVPTFVKQAGSRPISTGNVDGDRALSLRDRKGGDPSEWPERLRVREFPHHIKAPVGAPSLTDDKPASSKEIHP